MIVITGTCVLFGGFVGFLLQKEALSHAWV